MKAVIRIPTTQYAYFEVEFEGSEQEIVEKHNELFNLYNGGFGLEKKEWNQALDRYLTDGTGELEVYQRMNKDQQRVLQELKRAFKRINKE